MPIVRPVARTSFFIAAAITVFAAGTARAQQAMDVVVDRVIAETSHQHVPALRQ